MRQFSKYSSVVADVPGFVKHVVTPASTSVRISA
jgi:hypothetical protein